MKLYRLEVHRVREWTVHHFANRTEAEEAYREWSDLKHAQGGDPIIGVRLDVQQVAANGIVVAMNGAQDHHCNVEGLTELRRTGNVF